MPAFLTLKQAFTIADWAMLMVPITSYLRTRQTNNLISWDEFIYGLKPSYLAIAIWGLSMTSIKISVALTLLRFLRSTPWRVFLYIMIGLQAAMAISNTLWILLQCRPLAEAWNPLSLPGVCAPTSAATLASNVTAGFNISTDIILSLVPLAFIIKLQRPLPEKILLALLMAVGMMASVASIRKTIIVTNYFGKPGTDTFAVSVSIVLWTAAEQFIAVIAACLPSFKMLLQKMLATVGITLGTQPTGYGYGSRATKSGIRKTTHNSVHFTSSMGATQSEEAIYQMKTFDGGFASAEVREKAVSITSSSEEQQQQQQQQQLGRATSSATKSNDRLGITPQFGKNNYGRSDVV